MKASDIYKTKAVRVKYDLYSLIDYSGHIRLDEISTHGCFDYDACETEKRVMIKVHAEHDFDHRRYWQLSSVWFDNKPVMITQNAGREGCDHEQYFVTDETGYKSMIEYLRTFSYDDIHNLIDPDKDIPELNDFYGMRWTSDPEDWEV